MASGAEPISDDFPRNFGDYVLHGELGRGAMGVVYDAEDPRLDRRVALKILRTDLRPNSASLARFEREARSCASVRHDHIVEIYEAGEVEGRPFYAMARLEGDSLATLAKEGRLPECHVLLESLAGIADALETLHGEGIVHRDVKPGNIMVAPDGKMVLADFGLARTATGGDLTQTGEALGTPIYMSPEQALGKLDEVDGQTDVYSLGATIYEALAGRPVFDAEDTRGMMRMVLHDRPKPLRDTRPETPRECEAIVLKALEKDKRDRYSSAAAMRDDMLAFADGRPVVGRPVSVPKRFFRKHKLNLLAAACLLIAAVAVFTFWPMEPPPPVAPQTAILEVLSSPPARVMLDGAEVGVTPVELTADPGEHRLVMRLIGFEDHEQQITLRAGERRTLERVLVAQDPEDPYAVGLLAQSLNVPFRTARADYLPDGSLKTEDKGVQRGAVRSEELASLSLDALNMLAPEGKFEIRKDGELLWSKDISPRMRSREVRVPEPVRRALRSGDRLALGFRPSTGAPTTAHMHVVPDNVKKQLAELDRRLEGHHPKVICQIKANLFLAHGLDFAAYQEARMLLKAGAAKPHVLRLMKASLEGMDMRDCDEYRQVVAELARLSREEPQRTDPEK